MQRLGRAIDSATAVEEEDVRPLRFPGIFAFVGSACLLVLEIDAGRILAPAIGTSLYTWTSVIGVVLAFVLVGFVVLAADTVWIIYRIVKGWLSLNEGKPVA